MILIKTVEIIVHLKVRYCTQTNENQITYI